MPAPTAYTEQTLAQYMKDTLKQVAIDLNWLDVSPNTGDYREPVHAVEIALGVEDIADSTAPVRLIRLQADKAIWYEAVEAYVTAFYVGGLNRSLHREQLFEHAKYMLGLAEAALAQETAPVDPGGVVGPGGVPLSSSMKIKYVW